MSGKPRLILALKSIAIEVAAIGFIAGVRAAALADQTLSLEK